MLNINICQRIFSSYLYYHTLSLIDFLNNSVEFCKNYFIINQNKFNKNLLKENILLHVFSLLKMFHMEPNIFYKFPLRICIFSYIMLIYRGKLPKVQLINAKFAYSIENVPYTNSYFMQKAVLLQRNLAKWKIFFIGVMHH